MLYRIYQCIAIIHLFFSFGNNFELKDIITQVPAQSMDNCRVRWNCQPAACILCYLCDLESHIYFHKGVKSNPELRGMIPNSFEHIFQHISRSENQQYLVRASYLEIYQVRYSIQRCLHSCHYVPCNRATLYCILYFAEH